MLAFSHFHKWEFVRIVEYKPYPDKVRALVRKLYRCSCGLEKVETTVEYI